MTLRVLVIVGLAVVAASCGPGPLPDVRPRHPDYKADWFPTQSEDRLPLDDAIYSGRIDDVRALLSAGANPNERTNLDRTPLSIALQSRALRTARVLLQHGADVNQRWCERFLATWAAYASTPAHLAQRGKDPACTAENGITPLMWTAAVGDREAVELLLEFNADRSLRDWSDRSALHHATTREVWDLLTETRP